MKEKAVQAKEVSASGWIISRLVPWTAKDIRVQLLPQGGVRVEWEEDE